MKFAVDAMTEFNMTFVSVHLSHFICVVPCLICFVIIRLTCPIHQGLKIVSNKIIAIEN